MISLHLHSRQPARAAWSTEKLVRERAIALGHAVDPSTYTTYTSHLQSYLAFYTLSSPVPSLVANGCSTHPRDANEL